MALHNLTIERIVRETCRQYGVDWHDEANWHYAYAPLGLSKYPVSDETWRTTLNDKIIRHYFFHEMGTSAAGRFRMWVEDAMGQIIPYYDALRKSELLDVAHMFGITYDETLGIVQATTDDLSRDQSSTREQSASREGSGKQDTTQAGTDNRTTGGTEDTTSRTLDTPQAQISLLDDNYLTSATKSNVTSNGTDELTMSRTGSVTSESTQSDSVSDKVTATQTDANKGTLDRKENREYTKYDPNYLKILDALGPKLLNIDAQIIEDKRLRDCFWLVYDYEI